jgi:hypothetical protein
MKHIQYKFNKQLDSLIDWCQTNVFKASPPLICIERLGKGNEIGKRILQRHLPLSTSNGAIVQLLQSLIQKYFQNEYNNFHLFFSQNLSVFSIREWIIRDLISNCILNGIHLPTNVAKRSKNNKYYINYR